MGDECGCEKCRATSSDTQVPAEWPVEWSDPQADERGRPLLEQFLVVGERGIALR